MTLRDALKAAIAYAIEQAEPSPSLLAEAAAVGVTIKGRDPREPGRRRKLAMEERVRVLLLRRFRRQLQHIREALPQKSIPGFIIDTTDIDAELIMLFNTAILEGIDLFDLDVELDVEYSLAKQKALEYARTYVTEWLAELDKTSSSAVQNAVSYFISTPGATIGDAVGLLADVFGEVRAERIAVTEITRAYAEGNQLAGEDMAAQWPGVRVTKLWFTNNDDLVCPICGNLDGKEIDIEEVWEVDGVEYENPPAHPNCRCWTSVGTK